MLNRRQSAMAFALLIVALSIVSVPTNVVNSSVSSISTAATPIPVAYRALVLIALVIVLIILAWKALGLLLKAILVLVLLYVIVTLIIGVAATGTLTLHYTISYAQSLVSLFTKGYAVANTVSKSASGA